MYRHEAYLKPRSIDYIEKHRQAFFVSKIDGIIVGCVEKKKIDTQTVELGAVAISTKFVNQRVGVFTIKAFIEKMQQEGFSRFISLTNNPQLKKLYLRIGFREGPFERYRDRQKLSPGVSMFLKEDE